MGIGHGVVDNGGEVVGGAKEEGNEDEEIEVDVGNPVAQPQAAKSIGIW